MFSCMHDQWSEGQWHMCLYRWACWQCSAAADISQSLHGCEHAVEMRACNLELLPCPAPPCGARSCWHVRGCTALPSPHCLDFCGSMNEWARWQLIPDQRPLQTHALLRRIQLSRQTHRHIHAQRSAHSIAPQPQPRHVTAPPAALLAPPRALSSAPPPPPARPRAPRPWCWRRPAGTRTRRA